MAISDAIADTVTDYSRKIYRVLVFRLICQKRRHKAHLLGKTYNCAIAS